MFDGKNVSPILPFSRPDYVQRKQASAGQRLSISGYQTKMSLAFKDGQLEMVGVGGQYILKPIPRADLQRVEVMPLNEHLTMQIARQVFESEVADNALVRFANSEPAYLARCFDVPNAGPHRLQEDFAQIAGRSAETHGTNYKYEFSYEEIGDLIQKYVAAHRVDRERYFKLVVFNYLIHNGDAHTKNFSLIRSNETVEYRLTPAYDLLNTRLQLPAETRTALPLFQDDFEPESFEANKFYAHDDFVEFAHRLQLVPKRSESILNAFIDRGDNVVALVDRSSLPEDCKRQNGPGPDSRFGLRGGIPRLHAHR